jgi:hypothetical protein
MYCIVAVKFIASDIYQTKVTPDQELILKYIDKFELQNFYNQTDTSQGSKFKL